MFETSSNLIFYYYFVKISIRAGVLAWCGTSLPIAKKSICRCSQYAYADIPTGAYLESIDEDALT
jgi:hypothetical protein